MTDKQTNENVTLMQHKINNNKENETFIFAETAFEEFGIMIKQAVPIIFCNLCEFFPQWVAYNFVGHLPNSTVLLASVGLSMAFTNCIGISITWGMTKGLDTLIPQALGANDTNTYINKRISIYFQQSVIICYIILFPITIAMYYAGDIMCFIGQSNDLCSYINEYCRALIPFVISNLWFSLLCRLVRNLNLNNQTLFVTIISSLIAYPLNYLFITHLQYSYIYTAIAMDICMILIALLTTILLICKGYYHVFIPQKFENVFNKRGIKMYLHLSVPTLISSTGDWWITQSITLLSGYVYNPSVAVAATAIGNIFDGICCEINLGSAYPLNVRIGKYMGLGSVKLAKRAMYMGIIVTTIAITIIIAVLLSLKDTLPYIWISHSNIEVGWLSSNLMYFVCLRQLFYNTFNTLSSIYIGLGNQRYSATISTVCNFCVGLPAAIFILFYFELKNNSSYLGVYIIWSCNSFGYVLSSFILVGMLLCGYINWDDAVNAFMGYKQNEETFEITPNVGWFMMEQQVFKKEI